MRKGFFIFLLAATLMALVSVSPVSAGCLQTDMTGTWYVYLGGEGWWQRCTVVIRSDGTIASGTTCKDNAGVTEPVLGGKLSVNSSCVATGNMKVGPYIGTIVHSAVARDKYTTNGVGYNNYGQEFIFSATKK